MPLVLGVDEAGRGPLAGPLAVGVIAVKKDFDILTAFPGLNDSKKLSEEKRMEIFKTLQAHMKEGTVRSIVCLSSAAMIDAEGVTFAVRHALHHGVRKLLPDPSMGTVLLDGSLQAPPEYSQQTIIRGDETEPAIMLASVAAKVVRDRHMREIAKRFPAYGFETHKGYGTKAHFEALKMHGPCEEHRRLFLRKFLGQ